MHQIIIPMVDCGRERIHGERLFHGFVGMVGCLSCNIYIESHLSEGVKADRKHELASRTMSRFSLARYATGSPGPKIYARLAKGVLLTVAKYLSRPLLPCAYILYVTDKMPFSLEFDVPKRLPNDRVGLDTTSYIDQNLHPQVLNCQPVR